MSLRHAILGVLEFQPLHGYALKCVLEEGISQMWPVQLAAIYPSLRRLEEEGLVTHSLESTPSGRPDRKVYSITAQGVAEMERWRRVPPEPPGSSDGYQMKNPLLLKLLFAKRENLPDVVGWLDDAIPRLEAGCERTRGTLREPDRIPFFVRFLRETGLAHLELQHQRLTRLREQLEALIDGDSGTGPEGRELGIGPGIEV